MNFALDNKTKYMLTAISLVIITFLLGVMISCRSQSPMIDSPTNLIKATADNDATPVFNWDAGAAGYEVKIDDGSWTDVGNVITYTVGSALSDGSHTFYTRAIDEAANLSASSSLLFTVDTVGPSTPTNLIKTTADNDTTPAFNWAASNDATAGVLSYEVKINNGSWMDIGNVTTYTVGSALSDGSHNLYVRAKDSAENIGAAGSLAFTIDTEDTSIVQISIQGFAFSPATVTISVGATVTWANLDSVAHTATSDNAVFGSALLSRNATYSFTFMQVGQFDYHCTPHPYMTATIIVE